MQSNDQRAPGSFVRQNLMYESAGAGSTSQDIMIVLLLAIVVIFLYTSWCHNSRRYRAEQLEWPETTPPPKSPSPSPIPEPIKGSAGPLLSAAVSNATAPLVAISAKFATSFSDMIRQFEPRDIIKRVSARCSSFVDSGKCVRDAHEVFDTIPLGAAEVISHGDGQASDQQQATCERAARAWLAQPKNTNAAIMLYAPWCKHCHYAIPKFGALASTATKPFLLIDSSSLPRRALSGKDAIYDVEYYPTLLVKNGNKLERKTSMEELVTDDGGGGSGTGGISAWFASVGATERGQKANAVDPFRSLFHQ